MMAHVSRDETFYFDMTIFRVCFNYVLYEAHITYFNLLGRRLLVQGTSQAFHRPIRHLPVHVLAATRPQQAG